MDVTQLTKDDIAKLRNIPVLSGDGEEIGHVGDVYYDEDTGRVRCVGVAGDPIGVTKRTIPVEGATLDDGALRLPYAREEVAAAPDVDDLDEERYREVGDYYRQTAVGQTMTRSEEELRVGKTSDERQVRLRKWVETEPAQVDVELQRETARVVREDITEPVSGAAIGEDAVEVTLKEEEPVVEKQAVAKERIGIEKDVEVEHETVSDTVRKERVDVEGDTRE